MEIVLPLCPFPNVYWFSAFLSNSEVSLDVGEHFVKQSYRNRFDIQGHLGRQSLSLPIQRASGDKTPMGEIVLFEEYTAKKQHWRSLLSAYNSSPFFDYYRDSLEELFLAEHKELISFNQISLDWLLKQLKISKSYQLFSEFVEPQSDQIDLRNNFKGKKWVERDFPKYFQVFEERIGFESNLSALDLLFNMGPDAKSYLDKTAASFGLEYDI